MIQNILRVVNRKHLEMKMSKSLENIGGHFISKTPTERGKKTALFRKIVKDAGFERGRDHSEFILGDYMVKICFYPCTYGVMIYKNSKLVQSSNKIGETEFRLLISAIETETK